MLPYRVLKKHLLAVNSRIFGAHIRQGSKLLHKHSLTCSFAFSKGGVKGEGIGECSVGLLSLSHFVASLNAYGRKLSSPHFVGFANPILRKRGFVVSRLRAPDESALAVYRKHLCKIRNRVVL
jgi:hypothetical protein